MVAKVAGGIIGLGLIGTGSIAFAKPEWLGLNKEIPWTPLSADHDFVTRKTNDYPNEKFGGKYKYYLVGVVGTDSSTSNPNTNKAMWDELFKKWENDYKGLGTDKSSLGKEFKDSNIKGGIKVGVDAGSNNKYLNTVCEAIYKSTTSDITSSGESDKYKESSVWKYCSGLGGKPKTVEEVDTGKYQDNNKNLIGKDATDRKKLVSTKGNDKFWEIRDKEFKGDTGYDKIEGSGSADLFFSTSKSKDIRTLCGEAYGLEATSKSTSEADKPTKSQTLKYCSLDKSSQ